MTWGGERTGWNRAHFRIEKAHALDVLCVGYLAGVEAGRGRTIAMTAMGRDSHQRTNVNASGFPRRYLMRQKRIRGFQTDDLIRAEGPPQLKTAEVHVGGVGIWIFLDRQGRWHQRQVLSSASTSKWVCLCSGLIDKLVTLLPHDFNRGPPRRVNAGISLANMLRIEKALSYFEGAERLLHPLGMQYAAMSRQMLGR
jgi:hypothetical protein